MKNILLVSGGNDSMYIFNKYNKKKNFKCIYFDYGQRYLYEETNRVPSDTELINIGKLEIKENGYVKGRNILFLIEIAKLYDEEVVVWMGSNADDVFIDNNEKFLLKTAKLINIGFDSHIKLKLPLKNITKKEIMEYIINNNINTYSCYKGGSERCGICKACLSVINATTNS